MPLILDEMLITDALEFHGIQGGAVITVQKIRPAENEDDKFPTALIGKSIKVISVYPRDPNISPFYLNVKQTFKYINHPQCHTIDIYGQTYRHDVTCTESPQSELHILQRRGNGDLSIGYFELDRLRWWLDSVHTEYPEFFT